MITNLVQSKHENRLLFDQSSWSTLEAKQQSNELLIGNRRLLQYRINFSQAENPYHLFSTKEKIWKVLWKGKDSSEIRVGLGMCVSLSGAEDLTQFSAKGFRFYGGIPFFDDSADQTWGPFSKSHFFLPTVEWIIHEGKTSLLVRTFVEKDWDKARINREFMGLIDQYCRGTYHFAESAVVEGEKNFPSREDWTRQVNHIKESIQRGSLAKVVLSRCKEISFTRGLCIPGILKTLGQIQENSYLFAISAPNGETFLGRSPERLMSWENKTVNVDAIAGTKHRGETDSLDLNQEKELTESHEEMHEHRFVSDFVEEVLSRYCVDINQVDHAKIMKLKNVQHMISSFRSTMSQGVNPTDVLSALHPTPAVGGVPRSAAVGYLREFESYPRGWFAGPMGWVEGQRGDFALGIRSAYWDGKTLRIFAGAGIVEGSEPEQEWLETEVKMKNFLDLLN